MRSQKALVALLRGLVELLAEESERNPAFAERMDQLLAELHAPRRPKVDRPPSKGKSMPLPDVYAEWNARGETEFRLWLREQPLATIRAVIRAQDLDAPRRTSKWSDAEKLADFVAEGMRARSARGSAFIGTTARDPLLK